ncbi:V-set domain-containing T-cell activation inhibitor 1-like isoform X2 [Anabas testudineus]|uniref:V-set domain-containing T-cell activation inhibitor 1-like isoform X2 n=1 Tax=Anabas testudineus TaxID=64144 RepID=UPI000E461C21|nr:V-set domain-containing T-cell activation inhibitor 1-like isoform X2 [Anabas testudineus]
MGNNGKVRLTVMLCSVVVLSTNAAVRAEFELKCPDVRVETEPNKTVILPCFTEPQTDVSLRPVEWVVNDTDGVHLYRKKADDPEEQIEDYKGRTSLSHNNLSLGDCSLSLRVKMSDAGTYRCSVITETLPPPSCSLNLIGTNWNIGVVSLVGLGFILL